MSIKHFVPGLLLSFFLCTTTIAATIDLKIKNIEIDPQPAGISVPLIQLNTGKSYRTVVTILKTTALTQGASFIVRTECIRDNKSVVLGEARVGDSKGWNIYACYDLYPGEAGPGECVFRTTVDADNEINETDESATSNVWDRKAMLN